MARASERAYADVPGHSARAALAGGSSVCAWSARIEDDDADSSVVDASVTMRGPDVSLDDEEAAPDDDAASDVAMAADDGLATEPEEATEEAFRSGSVVLVIADDVPVKVAVSVAVAMTVVSPPRLNVLCNRRRRASLQPRSAR